MDDASNVTCSMSGKGVFVHISGSLGGNIFITHIHGFVEMFYSLLSLLSLVQLEIVVVPQSVSMAFRRSQELSSLEKTITWHIWVTSNSPEIPNPLKTHNSQT